MDHESAEGGGGVSDVAGCGVSQGVVSTVTAGGAWALLSPHATTRALRANPKTSWSGLLNIHHPRHRCHLRPACAQHDDGAGSPQEAPNRPSSDAGPIRGDCSSVPSLAVGAGRRPFTYAR